MGFIVNVATASWMRFRFQLKMHTNENKYANDVHDAHRLYAIEREKEKEKEIKRRMRCTIEELEFRPKEAAPFQFNCIL